MFFECAIYLWKVVYIECAKDWSFFEKLHASNVCYYVISLSNNSVYWMCKIFWKIVLVGRAKFSAFLDKWRTLNVKNYVISLSNKQCTFNAQFILFYFFLKCVRWTCVILSIFWNIVYFKRTKLCKFLEYVWWICNSFFFFWKIVCTLKVRNFERYLKNCVIHIIKIM